MEPPQAAISNEPLASATATPFNNFTPRVSAPRRAHLEIA
jgi:hypothetical protein